MGLRVGAVVGALLGALAAAITGIVSAWLVIGGGIVGAATGYLSEKRKARSHGPPSSPSDDC